MALLLATITTVVSFLSNLASPISLLGEFGVLCAIGIIGSFVTMTTFVPACKQLKDIRRLKKGKFAGSELKNNKSGRRRAKTKSVGVAVLDKTMGSGAVAAEHHPILVIIVVSLITIGAVGMALQLETTFNFEDFLPDDLDLSKDLEYMMTEFGISGGAAEKVDILVKGDITDPREGRDIVIVAGRNDKNHSVVNSIMCDDVNLLTDDTTKAKDWMGNEETYKDVYAKKTLEYLEIIATNKTPIWDSEQKIYVSEEDKEEVESASLEKEISFMSSTLESTEKEDVLVTDLDSNGSDEDELPF